MDPTVASEVLESLTGVTNGALSALLPWSYSLFALLFCWRYIQSTWAHVKAGNGLPDWEDLADMGWSCFMGCLIIGLYPIMLFPTMDFFRDMGMLLSGASSAAPDIGEVAAHAETITKAIDQTIASMFTYNPWRVLQQAELILMLRLLNFIISLLQVILALVGVWMYAKFCIGAVMGNSIIGTLAWNETRHFGLTGIGYSLWSIIALMALAFIQGISEMLTTTAMLGTSQQVTVPVLKTIAWTQGMLVMLAMAAPSVTREVMQSFAGSSGGPDLHTIPRTMGQLGGAGESARRMFSGGSGSGAGGGGGGKDSLPFQIPYGGGGGGRGGGTPLPGTGPQANLGGRLATAGAGGGGGGGGGGLPPSSWPTPTPARATPHTGPLPPGGVPPAAGRNAPVHTGALPPGGTPPAASKVAPAHTGAGDGGAGGSNNYGGGIAAKIQSGFPLPPGGVPSSNTGNAPAHTGSGGGGVGGSNNYGSGVKSKIQSGLHGGSGTGAPLPPGGTPPAASRVAPAHTGALPAGGVPSPASRIPPKHTGQ